MKVFFAILSIWFLLHSFPGIADEVKTEFKVPELTGPIIDEAGVIGTRHSQFLEKLIRAANARKKIQLTILTLTSLHDTPIEQATIKIVEKWKLGGEKQDNGVLFLVVPGERKARIEVGQGLEGDIPDAVAKRILADVSRPYFKKGLYGEGILAGAVAIFRQADPEFTIEGYAQQPLNNSEDSLNLKNILTILFIIFFFIGMPILRTLFGLGGGGRWGGGGFGGGFGGGSSGGGWSGGGGGFSGGGSSDSW